MELTTDIPRMIGQLDHLHQRSIRRESGATHAEFFQFVAILIVHFVPMTMAFPAPWSLRGYGYVFLYRFSPQFIRRDGAVPFGLRTAFQGGLGALMLVDYGESDCGPYRELLLIPGRFRVQGAPGHSITRIYVSSQGSVVHGRANWGIPKERADFEVTRSGEGSETWRVSCGGQTLFAATLRTKRWAPPVPVHTALLPNVVVQPWQGRIFRTRVTARGLARPCAIAVEPGEASGFPDLSHERPVLATGVRVEPFSMQFGIPQVSKVDATWG